MSDLPALKSTAALFTTSCSSSSSVFSTTKLLHQPNLFLRCLKLSRLDTVVPSVPYLMAQYKFSSDIFLYATLQTLEIFASFGRVSLEQQCNTLALLHACREEAEVGDKSAENAPGLAG